MNSIELNWLSKSDRNILLPQIIFTKIPACGLFLEPQKGELLIGNKYYLMDRGIIEINPDYSIPAAIAHEWRHLWQFYNKKSNSVGSVWNPNSPLPYREHIRNFFNQDPSEYDALLFELSKYPTDTTREWYEWIIGNR